MAFAGTLRDNTSNRLAPARRRAGASSGLQAAAAAQLRGFTMPHDPGAPAGSRQARNRLLTRRALERVRADALRLRRGEWIRGCEGRGLKASKFMVAQGWRVVRCTIGTVLSPYAWRNGTDGGGGAGGHHAVDRGPDEKTGRCRPADGRRRSPCTVNIAPRADAAIRSEPLSKRRSQRRWPGLVARGAFGRRTEGSGQHFSSMDGVSSVLELQPAFGGVISCSTYSGCRLDTAVSISVESCGSPRDTHRLSLAKMAIGAIFRSWICCTWSGNSSASSWRDVPHRVLSFLESLLPQQPIPPPAFPLRIVKGWRDRSVDGDVRGRIISPRIFTKSSFPYAVALCARGGSEPAGPMWWTLVSRARKAATRA